MLSFESDYNNGAHPEILRRLLETNDEPASRHLPPSGRNICSIE